MTQLPEVEVLRKDLEREIVGKRVKDVTVKAAGTVGRHRTRPDFVKALAGQKIVSVHRKGVVLVLGLDNGTSLVIRPGTRGSLSRQTATQAAGKHTQVVATFTTGGALHFADSAKDGEMFVVPDLELGTLAELSPTGIDPLIDPFTWPAFSVRLKERSRLLKALLMDDAFVVGLGDLYADEVLWAAGLSGSRASTSLSSQEVRRLYRAILEVLFDAVKHGGAGETGTGEDHNDKPPVAHHKVYGRAGEPCARCRQPIQHGKIDRRHEAFYCAQCQT